MFDIRDPDMSTTPSKKRFHPDGLHLSSSLPKRVYTSSESGSFADSAEDLATISGTSTSKTLNSSSRNKSSFTSALNSDCSFISCYGDSGHSTSGGNLGLASKNQDAMAKGKGERNWLSEVSKQNWIDVDAESGITYEKNQKWHSETSSYSNSSFVNTRLQESSSNIGFLNSRSEARLKNDKTTSRFYGYDSRSDQMDSAISASSGLSYMEFGRASLIMKERRTLAQKISNSFNLACVPPPLNSLCSEVETEESVPHFSQSANDRVKSCNSEDVLLEDEKVDEPPPSYILSSGRLSLEEEARLGRRAPTIDRDFEEYFSALML